MSFGPRPAPPSEKDSRESAGKVLQMTFPGCLEGSGWIKELPEDWEKR